MEENREDWENYKRVMKPYAENKGFYWVLVKEPSGLPKEGQALKMGSEVYTLNDKGIPEKASDAVKIAYQCDTEARNFLTQSLQCSQLCSRKYRAIASVPMTCTSICGQNLKCVMK